MIQGQNHQPIREELERRLVEIAHDAWRLHMAKAGWEHGDAFSDTKRTHDAMRRYHELDSVDQRDANQAVVTTIGIDDLANTISYHRGADQEFRPHQLSTGLRVQSMDDARQGMVKSWTVAPDDNLVEWITVSWDGGSETTDHASERTLKRSI